MSGLPSLRDSTRHDVAMKKLLKAVMAGLSTGLDRVTPARVYLVVFITALIILHGLVPDEFLVDSATVGLLGVLILVILVPLLKSATLPGGGGLNFRDDLDRLQKQSQQAEEDQLEKVSENLVLGSDQDEFAGPSSGTRASERDHVGEILPAQEESADEVIYEVLNEASRSPRVGLMLLSAELERAVHRLFFATGWVTPQSSRSLRPGVARLVDVGVLTQSAASALALFSTVRNKIVHGGRAASDDEVLRALDAGITLFRAVRAIPRERNVVAYAGVEIFADPSATEAIPDVKGVILQTLSPGAASTSYRIFPTTRSDYVVGKEVSWEWGSRKWGEAWYRDPVSHFVMKAWDDSMEFVGRPLDEL
jgi:hypothetical protein